MFYLTIVNKCYATVTFGWHDSKPHKQQEQQQTMNKRQQNHRLRIDSSRSYWGWWGLNISLILTIIY